MKKAIALLITFFVLLTLGLLSVDAATPINQSNAMFANNVVVGNRVDVQLPSANNARLNPNNALGPFDAIQGTGANEKFYAVGAHEYSIFTFPHKFWNVDGAADIEFSEVTWGNWHAEAVLVYLTGAYIRKPNGSIVSYGTADKGHGYYAGIAWNKIAIQHINVNARNNKTKSYLPGVNRAYEANQFSTVGNFAITKFHLPEEVVYATGIKLIDITKDVYNMGPYANTYNNNTDGYDLDAIKVYRYRPLNGDSATGVGNTIRNRGNWFMYNIFNNYETKTYQIQAGNPKNENIVGNYTITRTNPNTYKATYKMDYHYANDYKYDVHVAKSHLAISDNLFRTAAPGREQNQKFNVPFNDNDGFFYSFAHFEIEYR